MSLNITKSLLQREIGNSKFKSENFVAINYFNEMIMGRLRIEKSVKVVEEVLIDDTVCGGWNTSGSLLCIGQYSKGVCIFKPFMETEQIIPILQSNFLIDCVFMPGNDNLLTIATRSYSQIITRGTVDLSFSEKVKIWDVKNNKTVRNYNFNGFVYDIITSQLLPNNFWVSGDPETDSIIEFDVRSPICKKMLLSGFSGIKELFYKRCFDKNPLDETTIIVSGKNKILHYDRRTMSSQLQTKPYKTTNINSARESALIQLKFTPDGRNIILTKSSDFTPKNYLVLSNEEKLIEFEIPDQPHIHGTITKRFSFLGDSYVLFDTYFENYFLIYDYRKQKPKYMGNFVVPNHDESNVNVHSMPSPRYCLIAVANQGFINYITPTDR